MRPLGDVLLDLEPIIDELVDEHDLQFGDILNLVHGYLQVHRPDAKEKYIVKDEEQNDEPKFYYGP